MNDLLDALKESVKYWWLSLVVGLLAVIVGILSISVPLSTIGLLTAFFIASLLVGGLFDIFFSISNHKNINGWAWTLTIGIISVVFGIYLLSKPIESMLIFVTLAGFWVMFTSISSISGAVEMQRAGLKDWGWLLAFGILGVLLSLILVINPIFAGSFVIGLFSISMLAYGIVRIFYAFKMRKINRYLKGK